MKIKFKNSFTHAPVSSQADGAGFRLKKKSRLRRGGFTLIELLIAMVIFVIVLGIAMATIWSVMKPKAKTQTLANLQESANLGMEIISENIKKANRTNNGFVNFAITDWSGTPLNDDPSQPPTDYDGGIIDKKITGYRLNTWFTYDTFTKGPVDGTKAFGVYQGDLLQEETCNPENGPCVLKMISKEVILEEDESTRIVVNYSDISSPYIDVTSIKFEGNFWKENDTDENAPYLDVAPYVEITIKAQSRYQEDKSESGTITLKTTVSPVYNNPKDIGPLAKAYLYWKGQNMGEYLESSFDLALSGGTLQAAMLWDTVTNNNYLNAGSGYHCSKDYTPVNLTTCLVNYAGGSPDIRGIMSDNLEIKICTDSNCDASNYLGTAHLISGWGTDSPQDRGRFIEATAGRLDLGVRVNRGHASITSAVNFSYPGGVVPSYPLGSQLNLLETSIDGGINAAHNQIDNWIKENKLNVKIVNEITGKDAGPLKVFYCNQDISDCQYKGKYYQTSAGSYYNILGSRRYDTSWSFHNIYDEIEHAGPGDNTTFANIRQAVNNTLLDLDAYGGGGSNKRILIGY